MKSILELLFLSLLISIVHNIYPVAVFHGITDSCQMKNTSMLVNDLKRDLGVHVECIEVGNGYWDSVFMPIQKQAEYACEQIKKNPNFQGKFNLLGISQGTLISRYIIEKCDMKGQVAKYMSFDGPQMGIGSIPKFNCGKPCEFINNISAPICYNLMDKIAPCGYVKYRYDQETYNKKNVFLKMLNNENEPKDMEIYKRITSLEKFKMIKSKQDTTITPKESSWFEFYDKEGKEIVPLEETEFYKQDFIGLRKLMEDGKVIKAEFREEHVLYSIVEYFEEIVPFFQDEDEKTNNKKKVDEKIINQAKKKKNLK